MSNQSIMIDRDQSATNFRDDKYEQAEQYRKLTAAIDLLSDVGVVFDTIAELRSEGKTVELQDDGLLVIRDSSGVVASLPTSPLDSSLAVWLDVGRVCHDLPAVTPAGRELSGLAIVLSAGSEVLRELRTIRYEPKAR